MRAQVRRKFKVQTTNLSRAHKFSEKRLVIFIMVSPWKRPALETSVYSQRFENAVLKFPSREK